jgi:mRNA-degrading endonuclease toxin of MazEF toxin-antitoxin module
MPTLTPFIKHFTDWFNLKPKLDNLPRRLSFREREVWFAHFGVNVGFEIDGKDEFLRPCLVVKKISKQTFYAVPLTSKTKTGSWYLPSDIKGKQGSYILSQMRIMDAKRLKYFVETISEKEFEEVKLGFVNYFLQKNYPSKRGADLRRN